MIERYEDVPAWVDTVRAVGTVTPEDVRAEAEDRDVEMGDVEVGDVEVAALLRAAAAAPSSHNSQPWGLRWREGAVEVHADPERFLPVADPDRRELRLACGAALANVRVAVRAQGRRAHTTLLPVPGDPWFLGRVRPGSPSPPTAWEAALAVAVSRRRTDRHPFAPQPVPRGTRDQLAQAAQRERCWLVYLDAPTERVRLHELALAAHREQQADPRFVEEWHRWVGRADRTDDGIPARLARGAPRPDGSWRLRDVAGAVDDEDEDRAAPRGEDEPTIAVITTFTDSPLAHLQAGQAMQLVLLAATARGLSASFVAPPVEVPARRRELRDLLGGVLWPQAILRLGLGRPVPATPRRDVSSGSPPGSTGSSGGI